MSPEQFSALKEFIRECTSGSVPYPWVATVVGFLVLCLGVVGKIALSKDAALQEEKRLRLEDAKERVEEQKTVAVTLDRAAEALSRERGRAAA